MKKFTISTDSTSDFYADEIKNMDLYVGKLSFVMVENGKTEEYIDDFQSQDEYRNYYERLRKGTIAKTSVLNLQAHIDLFTQMAKDGVKDALHITQSMGLSPTLNNALMAIEEVKKEYPDINYIAIESSTTTVAEGNLVKIAFKLREKGYSLEQTVEELQKLKTNLQHFIMVNDLMYLKRGGRISGAKATIGTLLNLKPIIEFTKEGKLEIIRKESGFKKAFKSIITEIKQNFTFHPEFAFPTIVHTDNLEEAKILAEMIEENFGVTPEIRIMGPIIGAHVGPDAVAFTFLANEQRIY